MISQLMTLILLASRPQTIGVQLEEQLALRTEEAAGTHFLELAGIRSLIGRNRAICRVKVASLQGNAA